MLVEKQGFEWLCYDIGFLLCGWYARYCNFVVLHGIVEEVVVDVDALSASCGSCVICYLSRCCVVNEKLGVLVGILVSCIMLASRSASVTISAAAMYSASQLLLATMGY